MLVAEFQFAGFSFSCDPNVCFSDSSIARSASTNVHKRLKMSEYMKNARYDTSKKHATISLLCICLRIQSNLRADILDRVNGTKLEHFQSGIVCPDKELWAQTGQNLIT